MTSKWNTSGLLTWADGDVLYAADLKDSFYAGACPIGSIIMWDQDQTNTPALPSGGYWVECNGQTISDSDSPYNGLTIRDINGSLGAGLKGSFIRGHSTSGLTESSQNLSHTHELIRITAGGAGAEFGYFQGTTSATDRATGADGGTEARPSNMSMVFIQRIK